MTFCGFNIVMEAAMARLAAGIAMQTDKRADREKRDLLAVTNAELEELDILIARLSASPKRDRFTGMIGFAMLIRDLFAKVHACVTENSSISAQDAFAEFIKPFNRLMYGMDAHYFTRPEGEATEAKMTALVQFAESEEE